MYSSYKIICISLLALPIMVQAGYNGYIASHCASYHIQGMTYNKTITMICSPEWKKLTEEAKRSIPNR